MNTDLFHKAIMQSGCVFNPWAFMDKPLDRAFKLAKLLGCETDDTTELLEFFTSIPAADIVATQDKIFSELVNIVYEKSILIQINIHKAKTCI